MSTVAQDTTTPVSLRERLLAWKEILETANPPATRPARHRRQVAGDHARRGLPDDHLVGADRRAAGGHGGGAPRRGSPSTTGCSTISVVGLVLAHAANNMINDYFDSTGGVDTAGYVRALYAPHPILSGWVTRRQLGAPRSSRSTSSTPG